MYGYVGEFGEGVIVGCPFSPERLGFEERWCLIRPILMLQYARIITIYRNTSTSLQLGDRSNSSLPAGGRYIKAFLATSLTLRGLLKPRVVYIQDRLGGRRKEGDRID